MATAKPAVANVRSAARGEQAAQSIKTDDRNNHKTDKGGAEISTSEQHVPTETAGLM